MLRIKVALLVVVLSLFINNSYSYGSSSAYSKSMFAKYIEPTSAVLSIETSYQDSCAMRQAPGFVCLDCSVLARCVFRGNQWDTIALEACDPAQGLYCNANEQRCSSNMGPCHPGTGGGDGIFACTSSGVFPDPHQCQRYHMCFPSGPVLVSVNVLCGGNSAFHPGTSDCSLTTAHQICQGNQFTCDYVGQMGAWPLNANIYYICMARTNGVRVLFPQLFRCPVGHVFFNDDCVPGNNNVPGLPGQPPNYICSRPGIFYDPADCRSYFFCDGNLRAQRVTCPIGTYFNRMINACTRGTCI